MTKSESKKRIEFAVKAAEEKTSGEVVVSLARRSDLYIETHFTFAVLGWLSASLIGSQLWDLPLSHFLYLQALGTGLFASLPFWSVVKRLATPSVIQRLRVHAHAREIFWDAGLTETRLRTGVLILVSDLERRVEILADQGIHSKVGTGFWDQEVQQITNGIAAGKIADALCAAIGDIGQKLSEHFPPDTSNPNELPNTLREDD
ncbi:MAG: TPM domain-containing protein [Deltaproteobacteria bacterium]|nr:TPM domain-containing protein [Deltaproteobacteria bacterium]